MRDFERGGRKPGKRSQLVKDFLQGEILTPQDVSLAGARPFHSQDVATSNLLNISQVQSGIDIGGELALQKVHDNPPRRSWLDIIFAYRSRRIYHHDIAARAPGLERNLLGKELGSLIVPNHVVE